jgi:streptogramin lyase
LTVLPVDVSALSETGAYFRGGVLLPDGRVLLVPDLATAAVVCDPLTGTAATVTPPEPWEPEAFCGGVLLPDGRVFLAPNAAAKAWLFDPQTGSFIVHEGPGYGLSATGAVLLPDGRAAILPGQWGVADMQIFDPLTGGYTTVPELLACPAQALEYAGGVSLPDGRVVLAPHSGRDLLVWDPGCGVGYGRDVCLSAFWNKGV